MKEIKLAEELLSFIKNSPSPFHAVDIIKSKLNDNNFIELCEGKTWNLEKNGKYYISKNNSALIAFKIGSESISDNGFRIIGSHTDSPSFKIKPSPEVISEKNYLKLNTEVYGGPILNTWFDRPLSLSGRVIIKSENLFNPDIKLINFKKPLLIIPNLAIHMNRNVNNGVEINKQKDTLPLLEIINSNFEKDNYLKKLISEELKIDINEILDFELFLHEFEDGILIGKNNDLISASRLDNLQAVFTSLKAILSKDLTKHTNIFVAFDNEEVGSTSIQGADSTWLSNTLERIVYSFENNKESFFKSLFNSIMISGDAAHAVHPNFGQKSDITNKVIINKGPAIKISASQSYTTSSFTSSIFEQICISENIPYQKFLNRSDMRGGSTIGPISTSHLDIKSLDVGVPMLAMHSIRELIGVSDNFNLYKIFKTFYKIEK